MKKGALVISLLVISVLVLSSAGFASAGWFSDFWNKITGNTITGMAYSYGSWPCEAGQPCEGKCDSVSGGGREKLSDGCKLGPDGKKYTYTGGYYYLQNGKRGNCNPGTKGASCDSTCTPKCPDASKISCGKPIGSDGCGGTCKGTGTLCSSNNTFCNVTAKVCQSIVIPPQITCTDSDGGLNYYVKGNTHGISADGSSWNKTDECQQDDIILQEFSCPDSSVNYQCPNGCSDGACINQTRPICTDSDGGLDYFLQGDTINNTFKGQDICFTKQLSNSNIEWVSSCNSKGVYSCGVDEYYCSGTNVNLASDSCPNGCSNGACLPESNETPTCTDSDGGLNYYIKGYLNTSVSPGTNFEDYCLINSTTNQISNQLIERHCLGADSNNFTVQYSCSNGCSDGACINQTQPPLNATCTDSDGGLDYYVQGTVIAEGSKYSDKCSYGADDVYGNNTNLLYEAYCFKDADPLADFGYGYVYNSCPNGCFEGACLPKNPECIPRYVCVVNPSICPSSGVQEKSCQDFECKEKGYTEEVKCNPGECSGCELEGKCIPYGFRTTVELFNNQPGRYNLYCDIDGTLKEQKTKDLATGAWAGCQNNYECDSNLCSRGQCVEILVITGEANQMKAIVVKVICKLAHLFSLDEYSKCIYNYLGEAESSTEPVPQLPAA